MFATLFPVLFPVCQTAARCASFPRVFPPVHCSYSEKQDEWVSEPAAVSSLCLGYV